MSSDVDQAQKILNDLRDRRDEIAGRAARFAEERKRLAYSAHAAGGDKSAQERLRKANDESITCNVALESVDAAIVEATKRLDIAERAEAQQHDRAQAIELQAFAKRFVELAEVCDDCFTDFASAAAELRTVLDGIHQRGCVRTIISSW
jgi:hypothetical protein